jgi:C1A family cysteine protease
VAFGLGADISQDPGVRADEAETIGMGADFAAFSALPPVADLRSQMSPVANQGKFGSCTAFATVKGLQEFLLKKQGRFEPQSPAYLWYQTKKVLGKRNEDTGAPTELAVKMLDNLGTPAEESFPYLEAAKQKDEAARAEFLSRQPDSATVKAAKDNRILTGMHLTDKLSGVRRSLAGGMPVLLSMRVFESIGKTGKDGLMPVPKAGEKLLGGHAVLAVGYDNRRGVLIVRNSWGEAWAAGGYFYMPYDFVRQGHVRLAIVPKVRG